MELARRELEDTVRLIEQGIERAVDRRERELKAALREAERQGTPEAFERVARLLRPPPKPRPNREEKKLDELARRLPADRLSLTYAVWYGSPVLPPGLIPWDVDDEELGFDLVKQPSLPAGVTWQVLEGAGVVFTIYSAAIRQLGTPYRQVIEYYQRLGAFDLAPPYSPDGKVAAAYAEGPGLPRITIEVHRSSALAFPPPDVVDGVYKAYRRGFAKMLYDGGRKGHDARFAIRMWTVALLSDLAGMSRRRAITLWNERLAPKGFAYKHSQGVTSSGEIRFQQDYRQLQQRIARIRAAAEQRPRRTVLNRKPTPSAK